MHWASRLGKIGLLLLCALAGCETPDVPPDKMAPALVKVGMTPREVRGLMGRSQVTCWLYTPDANTARKVCFMDGMTNSYAKTTRTPGSNNIGIDGIFASDWPPRSRPPASATEVAIGMGSDQVARLLGKPDVIEESYGNYRGSFAGGRLTGLCYSRPPSPHGPSERREGEC